MARDVAGRCESPGSLPPLRCCRLCSPLNAVSLSTTPPYINACHPDAQVISTARTCNLIIIVLDCLKPITHKKLIEHELEGAWAGWRPTRLDGVDLHLGASRFCKPTDYLQAGSCCGCLPRPSGFGIRLNKKPPEITFRKKDKGGINYTSTVQNPKLDLEGALGDTGLALGDTGLAGGLVARSLPNTCNCVWLYGSLLLLHQSPVPPHCFPVAQLLPTYSCQVGAFRVSHPQRGRALEAGQSIVYVSSRLLRWGSTFALLWGARRVYVVLRWNSRPLCPVASLLQLPLVPGATCSSNFLLQDYDVDDLIDVIEGSRVYIPWCARLVNGCSCMLAVYCCRGSLAVKLLYGCSLHVASTCVCCHA